MHSRAIQGPTRYVGSAAFYRLAGRNGLLVLLLAAFGVMLGLPMPPRSSWILLWLVLTGFTGVVRFVLRDVLLNLRSTQHKQQACRHLRRRRSRCPVGGGAALSGQPQDRHLLDDNPAYWGRSINGVTICPPRVVMEMQSSIDQVLRRFLLFPVRNVAASSTVSRSASRCCRCRSDDLTSGRAASIP